MSTVRRQYGKGLDKQIKKMILTCKQFSLDPAQHPTITRAGCLETKHGTRIWLDRQPSISPNTQRSSGVKLRYASIRQRGVKAMILTACWRAVNHVQIRSPEAVHLAWRMQRRLDGSLVGGQDDGRGPPRAAGAGEGPLHECQFVLGPSLHVVPSVFNVFYRPGDLADWCDLPGYGFPDLVPVSMG